MSGRLIRQRRPNEASAFLVELERVGGAQAPCLRKVQEAADLPDHEEFEHAGRDKTFSTNRNIGDLGANIGDLGANIGGRCGADG